MAERSLKAILGSRDGPLSRLADAAEAALALTPTVAAALPDGLGRHLVAATLSDDGELTLAVRSPAWASRLRYVAPELIDTLRRSGQRIEKVTIRVRPEGRRDGGESA